MKARVTSASGGGGSKPGAGKDVGKAKGKG